VRSATILFADGVFYRIRKTLVSALKMSDKLDDFGVLILRNPQIVIQNSRTGGKKWIRHD
jgi:hypothetical protein